MWLSRSGLIEIPSRRLRDSPLSHPNRVDNRESGGDSNSEAILRLSGAAT